MNAASATNRRRHPLPAILSGLLVFLASLPGAAPAGAVGTSDQSSLSCSFSFNSTTFPPTNLLAQTFTAGLSGYLDHVDLRVQKRGGPGVLTAEIRSIENGEPTSTVLGSGTIEAIDVPEAFGLVSIPLSLSAPVTSGAQYALVLDYPGTSPFTFPDSYTWQGCFNDFYDGNAYALAGC